MYGNDYYFDINGYNLILISDTGINHSWKGASIFTKIKELALDKEKGKLKNVLINIFCYFASMH